MRKHKKDLFVRLRESTSLPVVFLVSFVLNCLSILEQGSYKPIYKLFISLSIILNLFRLFVIYLKGLAYNFFDINN